MEQEELPTIADFLGAAPWKHALFTTYALSLSYFESEVLRPLLRNGCDDIWVIADAEGYRASLLERRSMRVGQEYRLIPAAMPNGVLHAKSIYLSGEEDDLLLIGSGNITFDGHGKNAEVFEALVPDDAAQPFEDYADFLESFGSRPDVRLGQHEWIDEFAARARRAASRGQGASPPIRLLHSLESSVVGQLPALFAGLGPCHDALIMSPYHDPNGQAVRSLIEAIDPSQCAIAVAPGKTTPFPFDTATGWDRPVRAVAMAEPESRFIHAKWYEFEFPERRLLLTGSINATRKALTTIDNAELGILRSLPLTAPPLAWKDAHAPEFKAMDRLPSGLGTQEIVHAVFDRSDAHRLTGRLISNQEVSGPWRLRLVQADGETFSGTAELDHEGAFAIDDPELEVFSAYSAVQLLLLREGREARGWVHNEMLLSIGARRRLTAGAITRLMRREGSDDDLQALLDYLSVNAELHLRLFDQPVTKGKDGLDGEDKETLVTVHIDEIAPSIDSLAAAEPGHRAGPAHDDQFNAAMLRIRRVLLGQGRSRSQALMSRSDEVLAEEDLENGGGTTPEDQRRKLGLDDFEHAMNGMIDDAGDRQDVIDRLLVLLVEVGMWMRLARLNDLEGAYEFLSAWFFRACRRGRGDPSRMTALQQHVISGAVTLYLLTPEVTARHSLGTTLHGALERFYRGPVDQDHALARLFPDPHAGFSALLFGDHEHPDLGEALGEILAMTTRRQQLDEALTLAASGKPVPREWEVFSSEIGQELWKKLQNPDWPKRVRRGPSGATACSFCYLVFPVQEAGQMRRLRFTRCIHCKRFTVDTNP